MEYAGELAGFCYRNRITAGQAERKVGPSTRKPDLDNANVGSRRNILSVPEENSRYAEKQPNGQLSAFVFQEVQNTAGLLQILFLRGRYYAENSIRKDA